MQNGRRNFSAVQLIRRCHQIIARAEETAQPPTAGGPQARWPRIWRLAAIEHSPPSHCRKRCTCTLLALLLLAVSDLPNYGNAFKTCPHLSPSLINEARRVRLPHVDTVGAASLHPRRVITLLRYPMRQPTLIASQASSCHFASDDQQHGPATSWLLHASATAK